MYSLQDTLLRGKRNKVPGGWDWILSSAKKQPLSPKKWLKVWPMRSVSLLSMPSASPSPACPPSHLFLWVSEKRCVYHGHHWSRLWLLSSDLRLLQTWKLLRVVGEQEVGGGYFLPKKFGRVECPHNGGPWVHYQNSNDSCGWPWLCSPLKTCCWTHWQMTTLHLSFWSHNAPAWYEHWN